MANSEEPIVSIPVIVEPIEVEAALRGILVEIRHVAVTIDLTDGTLCENPSIPPPPEYSKG